MEDRERAEQRLEVLLYELFTNAPIAAGIRDIKERDIVHVLDNPRSAALFGKTPSEMQGVTDAELGVSREQIERAIARFRTARASGHPMSAEITIATAKGPRTLAGKVIALEDERAERYLFVLEDVSELRAVQSGLARAEALAALGTLSAAIGHEIGNPTMYAQLHLQFAIERAVAEGVSASIIDDIKTALDGVNQIARLIRDMRTLSADSSPATEETDVEQALETVLDLVGTSLTAEAKLHRRTMAVSPVRGSRARLVQVLLNLVRNAAESVSGRNGNVWIDVTQPSPDNVQIEIADDGPGIDPALRERLFEPFATTKETGTGLGLYVCRMLVRRAGGTIEAFDREGGGTRMRVILPVAT